MEDLLAQERAAEHHVHTLLQDTSQPIGNLLQAFDVYRQLSQTNILADFGGAEKREVRLWQAHTEGKKFFNRELKNLRKAGNEHGVEVRELIKWYLTFLKASERFYREYIHQLSTTFGGIPELEAVAQRVRSNGSGSGGESSQIAVSPEIHAEVLQSCHQTLIYLGDLSRYRASEQLDKKPDFGPAFGYYGLACTIRPSSGMGHHQQAVIALEQRHHLRAVYELYRAIVVQDPHPNAAKNLKVEFEKVESAFKKGELLPKSTANDPEAPKHFLTGWFVRMHSMCYKGQPFSGHDELEQTLLGQLSNVTKQPSLDVDNTIMRMVVVNLAAQYNAMEMFKVKQSSEAEQAFYWLLQLNLRTYTTLLELLYSELRTIDSMDVGNDEPTAKLKPSVRRVLPALRVYSAWLLPNIHIIDGLATDDKLKIHVVAFWRAYTRAIGIIANADVFGIWTLEDYRTGYMLEEDVDTIGFTPIQNEWTKVWRNWYEKDSSALKPRFSDLSVARMTSDEEMLARLMGLLDDGLYLAHEVDKAPITLLGTQVYYGAPPESDVQAYEKAQQELKGKPWPKPKPLSYAAAAAKSRAQQAATPASIPNGTSSTSSHSRQAQLSRMVDDLVDEEEGNNPVTPPPYRAVNPAIITNGDAHMNDMQYNAQGIAAIPSYQPKLPSTSMSYSDHRSAAPSPSTLRTPKDTLTANSTERLQSVSGIWNNSSAQPMSTLSGFPPGIPTGTLSSPVQDGLYAHSRVNSASSIRSRMSLNAPMGDSWSSLEVVPRSHAQPNGNVDDYSNFSASGMASPLLFGAGNNMWSTGPSTYRNKSPPNGQGGTGSGTHQNKNPLNGQSGTGPGAYQNKSPPNGQGG